MGNKTNIAWTEKTWNPWHGCQKVSPGCAHCYMYRDKLRYGQNPLLVQRSKTTFTDPLKWNEPALIFTCSWSDFFISDADDWRDAAWEVIRRTPQHIYQILTKRPERILDCLPLDWSENFKHCWLGISAEKQKYFDLRYPYLANVPNGNRTFLSLEPLIGPVTLDLAIRGFSWIIAGGESGGKDSRVCDPDWIRSLRDECKAAKVPFFFKQWGNYLPVDGDPEARKPDYDAYTIGEYGKFQAYKSIGAKAAGNLLDGRKYEQFPAAFRL